MNNAPMKYRVTNTIKDKNFVYFSIPKDSVLTMPDVSEDGLKISALLEFPNKTYLTLTDWHVKSLLEEYRNNFELIENERTDGK